MASALRLSGWPGAVLTALSLPENEPGGAGRRLAPEPASVSHKNFKFCILCGRLRRGNAEEDVRNSNADGSQRQHSYESMALWGQMAFKRVSVCRDIPKRDTCLNGFHLQMSPESFLELAS